MGALLDRRVRAKAHVVYDPDLGRPVYHAVTAANVNDITAAKEMPIEAGATYVFDLGYYDFGFWAKLDALGCRLATRFKTTTPLNAPRPAASARIAALKRRIGFLPARQAMNRKNPMQDAVREIVVRTETGQTLRLFTNDLDARRRDRRSLQASLADRVVLPGDEADAADHEIHREIRKCRAHPGRRRAHRLSAGARPPADHKRNSGFLELVRLVRANLMHRKDPTGLRKPPPPPPLDSTPTSTFLQPNLNRTAVAQGRP